MAVEGFCWSHRLNLVGCIQIYLGFRACQFKKPLNIQLAKSSELSDAGLL